MKKVLLLSATLIALFTSCDKSTTTPDNNGNNNGTTNSGTYTAGFTFNGSNVKLGYNKDFAQLVSSSASMVGGFATNSINNIVLNPALEITFVFQSDVTEADFMALKGQTIRQNNTNGTRVMVNYTPDANTTWYDNDAADNSYAVQINDITYSHAVTTVFNNVDVYRVKGTGRAQVSKDGEDKAIENIQFDMLMSRVK